MQDYQKYTVGIKGNNGNYNIKKEASTTSKSLYQTTKNKNIPFIILDTVQNSEGTWYKVQTDPTLLPGRNDLQRDNGAYDFNKIENMQDDIKPYITSNSKGFYKCFIKYFENIDNMYTNIKNMGE